MTTESEYTYYNESERNSLSLTLLDMSIKLPCPQRPFADDVNVLFQRPSIR